MEIGYARWAKRRDVLWAFATAVALDVPGYLILEMTFPLEPSFAFGLLAVLWMAATAVAGFSFWRRRARMTDLGVGVSGGPDGPWNEIGWDAVEHLRLLELGGLELSGAGQRVLIPGTLEDVTSFRNEILRRRGPALFRRLREAYARGETLEFHGPREPQTAAVFAVLGLVFMGLPLLLSLGRPTRFVAILFLGIPLWRHLHRQIQLSQRVTLDRRGLTIRRGLRLFEIAWEDIARATLYESGWLVLVLENGRRHKIPPTLSNFVVLQELVLAGPLAPPLPLR